MWRLIVIIVCLAATLSSPALAERMNARDLDVVARIMQFAIPKIASPSKLIILYDANTEDGRTEAALLRTSILSKNPANRANMVIDLQKSDNLDFQDADVVILTSHISAGNREIADQAAQNNSILISNNKACAQAARCIFAVNTQPLITLWFSRSAAKAAAVRFAPALLLLAKKL